MRKLRMGLVGAGLVGQAEHAYYLWDDSTRFDFVGLADASAAVRSLPKTGPAVSVRAESNQERRDRAGPLSAPPAVLVRRAGPYDRDRARVAGG